VPLPATRIPDHASGATHDHRPLGGRRPDRPAQKRALRIALALNAAFLVLEIAGGLALGSLSLLADGVHLLTDVAGLLIALGALHLLARPATRSHSYGLARAEVVGAQLNGLLLVGASVWIVTEAVRRFAHPAAVNGGGVIVVAVAGLIANAVSAVFLWRAAGQSLNLRAAFLHMLADAGGSIGVVVAGVAELVWHAEWVDPAMSLVLTAMILVAAWGVLRDTTHILMEGTPRAIDPDQVRAALCEEPGVEAVHHLHLWGLSSDEAALSAHVVLDRATSLHEAQFRGAELKTLLEQRFGIAHATLELECHDCEADPDGEAIGPLS
jgi:cobalt-zinc-cadmium efflux system protein